MAGLLRLLGRVLLRKIALAAALAALPAAAMAQDPYAAAGDSGDTAWILVSSAFVLLMALPGLGLFYGGLVRAKNFLSVLLQIGAVAAVVSLLWIVVGYTLSFGDRVGGWIGNGRAWMLIALGATLCPVPDDLCGDYARADGRCLGRSRTVRLGRRL